MCSIYVFCLSSVHVTSKFKRNFLYLSCFCFNLHFEHFHTAAFFSSRKMTAEISSHLLWYHSPETEQNAMKNLLSSFESSSKNDTQNFQYNGRRCIISFPRLTRFVCCENGAIVSFSNCANNVSSLHSGCKFFVQAYGCTDIGCKSYSKNSAVTPISLLLHRFWNYAKLCIFPLS